MTCIPLDATVVSAHSDKELAEANFKGFEHHPLLAACDNTGESLAWMLRPGFAGSNTAADHLRLRRGDRRAPASHELIKEQDRLASRHDYQVTWSVGWALGAREQAALGKVPESARQDAINGKGQVRERRGRGLREPALRAPGLLDRGGPGRADRPAERRPGRRPTRRLAGDDAGLSPAASTRIPARSCPCSRQPTAGATRSGQRTSLPGPGAGGASALRRRRPPRPRATSELEQYGRQIIASLLREQIAKREYDNQVAAIDNAAAPEEFLRTKFTNEDLYTWMRGQPAQTYYDCYKLAFAIAKKAELTLKHEVMRPDFENVDFVKFGYWNAGREGLLAGETLSLDLRRLELAYLEQNTQELELTKHVSLARLDPLALLRLKATGACEVTVPEWLFDMDSPGHYMRRLKTVAVTVPCVTGPYTGVHCTLSLLRSSVRVSSLSGDQYAQAKDVADDRFRDYAGAIQSIVTSSGQNDSGIFEVNLRDDRYLPFEGAGAISTWRIQLPTDIPQFDVETVSDVVLHLRYTAREAGNLRQPALDHVTQDVLTEPDNLIQLFTLNHDFVGAWNAFAKAPNDAARHLAVSIDVARFPYWVERLGMDDALVTTFAVIDWNKGKLTLAPSTVTLDGDAESGWKLDVVQGDAVFSFLKKNVTSTVYMTVSYAALS